MTQRAPAVADCAETSFGDWARDATVPIEVVMAAAARTFAMLDVDQQVDLLEEEMERWKAARANEDAVKRARALAENGEPSFAVRDRTGTLTTIVSQERDQMRNDLIYRLMHERFDLIYAIAVRLDDAPNGANHQQWLITPPRVDEQETPLARCHKVLTGLVKDLRFMKRKVEGTVQEMSVDLRRKR